MMADEQELDKITIALLEKILPLDPTWTAQALNVWFRAVAMVTKGGVNASLAPNPSRYIPRETWKEIVQRVKDGEVATRVAEEYGVTISAVSQHMRRHRERESIQGQNNKSGWQPIEELGGKVG